jgi:hypothetical protein
MKAKLISMTDFVLEQNKKLKNAPDAYDQYCKIVNYANFLKQPLKLEMFVPCDEDGNFLEEPIDSIGGVELYTKKYQQAKDEVLFEYYEGFLLFSKEDLNNQTIEHLLKDSFDYILTKSAIKQINL